MNVVNKGLAIASIASERMARAVENKTAVHVWYNGCPYVTCESMESAKRFVGKNRGGKYKIVPMLGA